MKCGKNLWFRGAALLLIAITLLLAADAGAQVKYKTLYRFKGGEDGRGLAGGLVFDQTGNLYGTTQSGGANDRGTVFELSPNQNGGWTKSVLYSFCSLASCGDGTGPFGGVIFDQLGNLYGTTAGGGTGRDGGTVFQLTPHQNGGWTESVLYSFCSLNACTDGFVPLTRMVFDQAGNLYGATEAGGANDYGTVFQLTPNPNGGWTENVLYSFTGVNGSEVNPSNLIFDQAGNLYGGTTFGGLAKGCHESSGCGVAFKLTRSQNGGLTESTLHSFCSYSNCADGKWPFGGLVFDQAGNLYGTAELGGAYKVGIVFQLTPNQNGGWTENVLHRFCRLTGCHDGAEPVGSVTFDQAGNLYGTTAAGGSLNFGVVFKMVPKSGGEWSYQVIHNFADRPGAYPGGALIFDAAGNLYGTTSGDGTRTFGSVFEITP